MVHINYKYSFTQFLKDILLLEKKINAQKWNLKYIYGPPRGGCVMAVFLSHFLGLKYLPTLKLSKRFETLIVDDVSDTGHTLLNIPHIEDYKVVTLFIKPGTKFLPHLYARSISRRHWIIYWWEKEYWKQ